MTAADTITVARSYGPVLTKRLAPGKVQACDNAKRFDLFTRTITGLGDLEELLRTLLSRPDCAVVRGGIADPARTRNVRRLLYASKESGEPASLIDAPRYWLALDFDALPVPPALDLTDLIECGKLARAVLPAAFHAATCLVQATGQHTINGAHLRLWFWLTRATSDFELKVWLRAAPVDHSLFNPAQLVYTAGPLFTDGLADPLPERLAVLFGADDVVAVPDPAVLRPRPSRPPPPPSGHVHASGHTSMALMTVATSVLRAPVGQRHKTLVLGARRLAELETAGLLAPAETETLLIKAARGCGLALERDLEDEVARILAWARRTTEGDYDAAC
jgi:hypothetical protein